MHGHDSGTWLHRIERMRNNTARLPAEKKKKKNENDAIDFQKCEEKKKRILAFIRADAVPRSRVLRETKNNIPLFSLYLVKKKQLAGQLIFRNF